MKNLLLGLGIMATIMGYGQTDRFTESKITNVTVFLNKAQVTRELSTRVDAGKSNIILPGLTSLLDPSSIQVSGKGNFIILGIAHQQNYLNDATLPQPLRLLKDSLTAIQKRLAFEHSQHAILSKEETLLQSNQKIGGGNQNLSVNELKAMADFYRMRLTEILTSQMKIDDRIGQLNSRSARLQQQIAERNASYQTNTSEIVISISAAAATTIDLDIQYLVANAGWMPVYDLRAINTKSPVQLNYKANVFQATGEEWKNVKLKLSTANPNLGGLKPTLDPWFLNFDEPVFRSLKGKAAGVMRGMASSPAMDQEQAEDAVPPPPAETIAQYTTTIQTTLNTEFDIALPYTVNAANKPTLVDIRSYELKAGYRYAVAPKLDLDAFLLANVTGWEDLSLLPGEANVFFEGTFVAKSYIDPQSIKDTLSVSLGRDKRIVVKREKLKDIASRKLIGTNQRERYAYEISVRNTKSESIKLAIEDQVPVSQDNQIVVDVLDTGNATYNADTGKMTWEVSVPPNETKKVGFTFEIKYPKDRMVATR
jgi:uncharacterized protein (TIGR02231 family)